MFRDSGLNMLFHFLRYKKNGDISYGGELQRGQCHLFVIKN